ncbi:MAG: hypothetical protein U9Q30_06180 [Campylobacterota bacterium]|nr:hypothetical protein [Campylobacterota bacterium]
MKKVEIEKPDGFLKLVHEKRNSFLYHDHPNDGIDLFCDEEVEELGYESVVFDFITYRGIAEFIEANCEGTLTFNNHPMGFNGFVEVDDIEDVRKKVKSYITAQIVLNRLEEYDDEQKECLDFLNIKIP